MLRSSSLLLISVSLIGAALTANTCSGAPRSSKAESVAPVANGEKTLPAAIGLACPDSRIFVVETYIDGKKSVFGPKLLAPGVNLLTGPDGKAIKHSPTTVIGVAQGYYNEDGSIAIVSGQSQIVGNDGKTYAADYYDPELSKEKDLLVSWFYCPTNYTVPFQSAAAKPVK